MNTTKRVVRYWLGASFAIGLILVLGRGRPEANAHPSLRGGDGTPEGSDIGFGGLDFYQS